MRPRHSHSLLPHSGFHGKDMHVCVVHVRMLWMAQVHMVRHSVGTLEVIPVFVHSSGVQRQKDFQRKTKDSSGISCYCQI